jgi:glycosyltransferase involved in cell wall biosynthesis
MRLLIFDQFSELGGAQQCLLDLLPAIQRRGWQASAGLPGNGPLVARIRNAGLPVSALDSPAYTNGRKTLADAGRFLTSVPRVSAQIQELAERFSADLLYINGPRLLPAAAGAGLPVVFHAHSFLPPGPVRTICGFALRQCRARVIASCRFVADPWREYARSVRVIYNGVAGPAGVSVRRPRAAPAVGCIGRIAPEKGQLEFLAAARLIHRAIPECRFVIYGESIISEPDYENCVRRAAEGLPVEFAGWTNDVYRSLEDLDAVLVPSAGHEATTRVILEAFAAGTPVIAFPSGGIPEVIDPGRTGLLAKDAAEMAEQTIALLRDAGKRESLAAAAHESWEEQFTLESWRNSVLDFLAS